MTTRHCGLLLTLLLYALLSVPLGSAAQYGKGALVLVGDVLAFNQRQVWRGIVQLAGGSDADIVVIAAAHERPRLYGGYAERALSRYAPFVELLPIAESPDEFGKDYREAVRDKAMIERIGEADMVFFVGGSPQRLSRILFTKDGNPTPLATAVIRAYSNGAVIVGGIPGPGGADIAIDARSALVQGMLPPLEMYRGLDMLPNGWYADQHLSSAERLAETLVAMRQMDKRYAIGVGSNAAAVLKDGQLRIIGKGGTVLIDLSAAANISGTGFGMSGVRLSYLEGGDRLDLATLRITANPHKLEGFELTPAVAGHESLLEEGRVVARLLVDNTLDQLLLTALNRQYNRKVDTVFPGVEGSHHPGFMFRFYPGDDTRGWITTRSGSERFTVENIVLDVVPIKRGKPLEADHPTFAGE